MSARWATQTSRGKARDFRFWTPSRHRSAADPARWRRRDVSSAARPSRAPSGSYPTGTPARPSIDARTTAGPTRAARPNVTPRRTSDASAGFGASASAFRIPCSRRSPRAFRARGGWTNHCPVQRGRTPLYQRSITRGLGCRKGGSLRRMATKALTLFSCAFSTPANATYR